MFPAQGCKLRNEEVHSIIPASGRTVALPKPLDARSQNDVPWGLTETDTGVLDFRAQN